MDYGLQRRAELDAAKTRNRHATIFDTHRNGDSAGSRQRLHRSDGAEAISEGADSRRLRADFVLRLALHATRRKTESEFRDEFPAIRRRFRAAATARLLL